MASLIRKNIHGHSYYYARQSARVDGRPKIVKTWYLGRVDDIIRSAPTPPSRPPRAPSSATSAPPRPSSTSPSACASSSTSTATSPNAAPAPPSAPILLVAVLNRCLAPCSKAGVAAWFERTVLPRLLPVQARQLSSQRFWDNFDRLSPDAIQAIECDLVTALVRDFEIDLRQVLFDATNFFTFLDTFNNKSSLAQ